MTFFRRQKIMLIMANQMKHNLLTGKKGLLITVQEHWLNKTNLFSFSRRGWRALRRIGSVL